jgi:cation transport protein ChaC
MWVFGYGSLIWDSWEKAEGRNCLRSEWASLANYRRVFTKQSVVNWGTKELPCPTLNLENSEGSICRGKAFEFSENVKIVDYLAKREATLAKELLIDIDGVGKKTALVYIYEGKNRIDSTVPISRLAAAARSAKGRSGRCVSYVKNVAEMLAEQGIKDEGVVQFYEALMNR